MLYLISQHLIQIHLIRGKVHLESVLNYQSAVIDRQKQEETYIRLNTWCTLGNDRTFGNAAISGANLGRKYGESNKGNTDALRLINDFDWLKEQFYASNI
jgi:hypothetical protein